MPVDEVPDGGVPFRDEGAPVQELPGQEERPQVELHEDAAGGLEFCAGRSEGLDPPGREHAKGLEVG